MRIILTADVKKVGQRGQVVTVADGFAMNVLIPKKQAVPATPENMRRHDREVTESKLRVDQGAVQAKELLTQIDGKTLTIEVKASETGTLFKSIHASDIVAEIKKQWGITLPESAITLDHPIKQKGTHAVPVGLLGALAKINLAI